MKIHFNIVGILLASLMLTSCVSGIKALKVEANAEPIHDLSIAIRMGNLSTVPALFQSEQYEYKNQFKTALENRFPKIFQKNGVSVLSILVEEGGNAAKSLPNLSIDNTKASHLLILNAKSVSYETRGGVKSSTANVFFDAVLWDVKKKEAVWKASPFLNLARNKPLHGSEYMAAQILNAMNADGLINMTQKEAVDLSGETISVRLIWDSDSK